MTWDGHSEQHGLAAKGVHSKIITSPSIGKKLNDRQLVDLVYNTVEYEGNDEERLKTAIKGRLKERFHLNDDEIRQLDPKLDVVIRTSRVIESEAIL